MQFRRERNRLSVSVAYNVLYMTPVCRSDEVGGLKAGCCFVLQAPIVFFGATGLAINRR